MSGCRYNTCSICTFKDVCQIRQDNKELKNLYNRLLEQRDNDRQSAESMREALDKAATEITELRDVLYGMQAELDRSQAKIKEANKLLYSDLPDGEILGSLMEAL